jgi:hypothetical protein
MNSKITLIVCFLFLVIIASKSFSQNIYFPPKTGSTWETVSPDSLGWCTDKIDTLFNFIQTRKMILMK